MALKNNSGNIDKGKLKVNRFTAFCFIVLLIIISVVGVWMKERRAEQQIESKEKSNPDASYEEAADLSTKYYDYELENFGEQYASSWDERLIRRNKRTGEETTVVESVESAISELKEVFNLCLTNLAMPENSKLIYFQSVYSETSDSDSLYSFDVDKAEFKKMKINEVCNESMGGFELSPDQTEIICAPYSDKETGKTQIMYLANLADDNYQEIVKLSNNETFNAGDMTLSAHFDIKWTANDKIEYSVYDWPKMEEYNHSGDFTEDTVKDALIEYREYNLSGHSA